MSESIFLKSLSAAMGSSKGKEILSELATDANGMQNLLNSDIVARLHDPEALEVNRDAKFECDILIVTPIVRELRAAVLAFDLDYDKPQNRTKNLPVFDFSLERASGLPDVRVRLTTLNSQRNVNSGPRTSMLLEQHKPRVAVLSGIAGIRDDKVLGECSAFSSVIYVAGGVETPDGKQPENQVNNISEEMNNLIFSYEDRRDLASEKAFFRDNLFEKIQKIDGEIPSIEDLAKFQPKFSVKKLLSGETLRKDGGFTEQAGNIDRLITMVEMEASGFAISCELARVEWLVFRSSCDYANVGKNDSWQRVAALNSALSIRHCIEKDYRTPEEMTY